MIHANICTRVGVSGIRNSSSENIRIRCNLFITHRDAVNVCVCVCVCIYIYDDGERVGFGAQRWLVGRLEFDWFGVSVIRDVVSGKGLNTNSIEYVLYVYIKRR